MVATQASIELSKSAKFEEKISNSTSSTKGKKARFTLVQWMIIFTLGFGNFAIGACVSLQAPFYPMEAEKKGATPTEYGLVFGVYQLFMFLMAPVMAKLLSLGVSPNLILNSGIFLVGSSSILFGVLDLCPPGLPFIALSFATRIVEGIGAISTKTASYTIIAYQFTDGVATVFSTQEMCLGFGLIAGPTIGGALYEVGGYELPFFVAGGLLLVDAIVIFFVLPDAGYKEKPKPTNMLKFYFHPAILLYSFAVFTSFNVFGFNAAMLEPHIRQFGLRPSITGLVFIIGGGVYAMTSTIWGWLCDKQLVKLRTFQILGCCMIIGEFTLLGPASFIPLKPSLALVIIAQFMQGFCGMKLVSSFLGALANAKERGYPHDVTTYALVSAMYAGSTSLGSFIGPTMGGALVQTYGFRATSDIFFAIEIVLLTLMITYHGTRALKAKKLSKYLEESASLLESGNKKHSRHDSSAKHTKL